MAKSRARAPSTLVQRSRRVSPQDKAVYAQTGRRPFLGLTRDDITAITARLVEGLRTRRPST